jgi:uncharacterized membrane-anchored protein YitT (DUF2179 family)
MPDTRLIAQMRWELRELLQALRTARFYGTLLATALGCVAGAVAINGVLIPRNLFSPGTSGTSLLIYYLTGWPSLGVIYLLLNLPIFAIGWREYALKYVAISAFGVLMFSGALILTQNVIIPAPDPLMAAIIAGVLMGAGTGFYLRLGGSAGGLDILATYVRKKLAVPIGTTVNAVNGLNLLGALLMFDLSTAFYSAVFMWVNSWTLDKVQTGFSQHRAVFIITKEHEAVAQAIRTRLDRGVTLFAAQGSYSGAPLQVVYSVISMYELGRLKDIMFQVDPSAYVMVTNTTEVIGRRFQTWEQEGYRKPMDWNALEARR